MSLLDCIETARKDGEISDAEATRMREKFKRYKSDARKRGLSEAEADAQGGRDALTELEAEAMERKRRMALQAAKVTEVAGHLKKWRNAKGDPEVGEAAILHAEHQGEADFSSAVGRRDAIIGLAHAQLNEILIRFRRDWKGGTANKAELEDVVKEGFGENTGSAQAKAFAKAWHDVAETLRQAYNAAGGAIAKLEGWGFPQRHDPSALRGTTKDYKSGASLNRWITYITPKLDREKTVNPLTGRPMGDSELREALIHVYESITTGGWADGEATATPKGAGAVATRRADHRFLHFKSATDYIEYQAEYGRGDVFGAMMDHINGMARDIALMETFGPNPKATINWLGAVIRQEEAKAMLGREGALTVAGGPSFLNGEAKIKRLNDMYAHISGGAGAPLNETGAHSMAIVRNVSTAAALGSALFSSLSDLGTNAMTRAWNDMPIMETLTDTLKLFKGQTARDRQDAVAAGLIMNSALNIIDTGARQGLALMKARGISSLLADRVLAASLLNTWTVAGRHGFGMGMMREAARHAHLPLEQLPKGFRNFVTKYGLDWDGIRAVQQWEGEKGVGFLRPVDVAKGNRELGLQWLEAINRETEWAVPEGTVRARSALIGDTRPGTWIGEGARSFAQFKTFSIGVMLTHGRRVFEEVVAGRGANALGYAAAYGISMTAFGALALQLKDIAKGRDPRPMTGEDAPKFLNAAIIQGGGFGILGDFLYSSASETGAGPEQILAGPAFGQLARLTGASVGQAIGMVERDRDKYGELKDVKSGRKIVRAVKGLTPGASIWWARLAMERLVFDEVSRLADPDAQDAFDRAVQRQEDDMNSGFWWAPGTRSPQRGVDA
ncbi:MAG: hypothetical protein RLZZ157_95 [Pseudomonadota bacterium]